MALHTILGANGTIATELIPILLQNKEQVRLVSRNPKPIAGTETVKADVTNREQVFKAVEGSGIVYLLVGIEYTVKAWRANWPGIMRNVIDACKAANAKLIFFDNIYMYGRVEGKITEDTPFRPVSKKGEVRMQLDNMLLEEIKKGALKIAIAKATDFYGPRCTDKSAPGVLVFGRLKKAQTAQCLITTKQPRTYSYTPGCAQGVCILATHDEAFGQVWHMPTAQPTPTGRQFIDIAAKYMNAKNKIQVMPKWMLKIAGWFNPYMNEMYEMMYQWQYPLVLDSSKFEKAFNFKPTNYEDGIKATAEWYLNN